MTALAPLLQTFFVQRMMHQRQASGQTIASYRDTFRLLLQYAEVHLAKPPAQLALADLDARLISHFLDHLETKRHNTARTRNQRRAAIRAFYRYAALQAPECLQTIQQVLPIPAKRHNKRLITYLTRNEVEALLRGIDTSSWIGRRDYALLALALFSGLRVSELTGLRAGDVHLGPGAHIGCTGKGRKERAIPVSIMLAQTLAHWIDENNLAPDRPLFPNQRGSRLSRDGLNYILQKHVSSAAAHCPSLQAKTVTPHVLRHTTAVHLLQAGADVTLIALWLGHESITTTHVYLDSDLEHKRRILQHALELSPVKVNYHPDDQLLAFLNQL